MHAEFPRQHRDEAGARFAKPCWSSAVQDLLMVSICIGALAVTFSCRHPYTVPESSNLTTSSYEVLALPAGVHARQIYFEKLVLNVPPGQKFGVVSSGLYCQSTEYLYWTTPAPTIVRDDDVRRTFNEILDKAGYPVTGRADVLFEDVSQIELIVAGLVVDFHVQPCDPSDFGTLFSPFFNEAATSVTGTTRINVKWQVYDLRKKQVVYETATEGVYAEPVKAIHTRLLMLRAFGKATEGLLAEEGFRKLITQEGPAHTKTM